MMYTVDVNYISKLSDLQDFLENKKDDWLTMYFLSQSRVNRNDGDRFVDEVYTKLKQSKEKLAISDTVIVAEQPSFRMERELDRIMRKLGSTILGLDSEQTIHVFVLNSNDYSQYDGFDEVMLP